MVNSLRLWMGMTILLLLPACLVFQSSTDDISARSEYCEAIIDYCLIYPDTLEKVGLLEEEHGVRLSMAALNSELVARGFRNYIYQDMQGWHEDEIRSKEAEYDRVEILETDYTTNFLRLTMKLDGRLHLVQVHRLDQERWVVVRWQLGPNTSMSDAIALFDRVDVIPGTID